MIELVALVIIAVMLGFLYAVRNKRTAERHYDRMERGRKIGGALILTALVATFIMSGDPFRMGLALIAALLIGLYIGVERPHEDVI